MKAIKIILILLITSWIGCKKVKKLTTFTMDYQSTVIIPSSTGINLPFNLFTPDMPSNSEATFAVNDTRKDLIEQIKLNKLDLKISSPQNGDFGFLKSIEIYITAEGLAEEKIAWQNNIPDNAGNILILETSQADLKEYIKKEKFNLKVKTVIDQLMSKDHHIDINSQFFVDAKVIGL
jgi:hypothetical protein